ncbi:MAG TPA: hypothetical protein DCS93_13095 [Microscillaceae bacterium]|nr:hypothetical protein [Microscillaceae bacterium]
MKNRQLIMATALVAGILLLINLLAREYSLRLDFTADKRYTLSKVTKNILKELNDPITVTVYFSTDLPPQLSRIRREFEEMLNEYANRSGGKLVYEFINPNSDPQMEQKATTAGIQPLLLDIREKDQIRKQKAFMGAVIQMGEQKEVIPVLTNDPIEYALSSNIKKLSATKKPKVAFLQGHKEPPVAQLGQLNQMLGILYKTEALFLTDSTKIPEDVKTIAIVAPKDSLPPSHLKQLDDFMAKGGNIVLAISKVEAPRQMNTPLTPVKTGLEKWLKAKGVSLEDKTVIDVQCGRVVVPRRLGNIQVQSEERFFYFPVLSKFADHPAAKGLEAVLFQFTTPLKFSGDSAKKFTPLAYTSERSGVLPLTMPISIQRNWQESDFNQPRQVVAAALEGKIVGNKASRMVIFANGGFIVPQQQNQALNQDNVNFMANAIDWLSDDTGLIELRTKQVQYRPLRKDITEGFKAFAKYFNLLFPILLVIGYGFFRAQKRKAIRKARMGLTAINPNKPAQEEKVESQN